jgi:type IV secretory pathway TrbD component
MKKRASFLKGLLAVLVILVAGLFISGYGYLIELGAKVIEL